MQVVNFETAKKLRDAFPNYKWNTDDCVYLYINDNKQRLINWGSVEADYYLKDDNRFYPAPFIQAVIEMLEQDYDWSIYIVPEFDKTTYKIHENHANIGKDYVICCQVGDRFSSTNRAIQETIDLIKDEIFSKKINLKF